MISEVAPQPLFKMYSKRVNPAPRLELRAEVHLAEERHASKISYEFVSTRIGSMRILIVDDSKLNRKFMARLLSTSSNELTTLEAEDGMIAIDMLKSLSPTLADSKVDVILMDVIDFHYFK